jgi:hypothetical protein
MSARIMVLKVAVVAIFCAVMPGAGTRTALANPAVTTLPKLAMPGPAAALRLEPPASPLQPGLPEPASLLLVGGALVGFGLVGRKRRSALRD